MPTLDEMLQTKLEYDEAMRGFRPVLGNSNHIRIAEYIGKLTVMEGKLAAKGKKLTGATRLEQDIHDIRRQVLFLIKN